jgi:ribonuclease D
LTRAQEDGQNPREGDQLTTVPRWVSTEADLSRLAHRLGETGEVAVDTEADSLHHYPERLALIQVADRSGETWLVDPLAIVNLTALAPVFAAPRPLIVLHAGENDLVHLKSRFGFSFTTLFDTSLAARFLGVRNLGLDTLLTQYLAVELPPSRQKDDWSVRPLNAAQERYAVADVEHLLALKDRLTDELRAMGRLAWVEEECAALAAEPAPERTPDPQPYLRLKGARELCPRKVAIVKALHELRERLAVASDRPPFKVMLDATLVALAQTEPASLSALAGVPGCTPRVVARWGQDLLDAITTAQALPESALPTAPTPSRPPIVPAGVRRRIEALRAWRLVAAPRFGLDPGVLLPNRLIRPIAEAGPRSNDALATIPGVRHWRVDALGPEILQTIA